MQKAPLPMFDDCSWKWSPVDVGWPSFSANFYANTAEYNDYVGVSFAGPKMIVKPWQPRLDYVEHFGKQLEYGFCQRIESDGSTWNVQRVGPFYSTGNYSWHQFTGLDIAELSQVLQEHGAIGIHETFAGPIDSHGEGIPFPPLHVHHIHITPCMDCFPGDAGYGSSCSPAYVWFREQHGDYCTPKHTELLPAQFTKLIRFSLELDRYGPAEINDARAPGSVPVEWYLQFAFRWSAAKNHTRTPLSLVMFGALGVHDASSQMNEEAYWWVPSDQRLVSIYESTLSTASIYKPAYKGKVLFVRPHMHLGPLRKAFLFTGLASDIGLSAPLHQHEFLSASRFTWLPLVQTDFATFEELEAALVESAGERLKCTFTPRYAKIAGTFYDRPGLMNGNENMSCGDWLFDPEVRMTSLSFMEHVGGKAPPWEKTMPKTHPMHSGWYINIASPVSSCYAIDGMPFDTCMPPTDLPVGYTPAETEAFFDQLYAMILPGRWQVRGRERAQLRWERAQLCAAGVKPLLLLIVGAGLLRHAHGARRRSSVVLL